MRVENRHQTSPVVSGYVLHVVACWPYNHAIDVAHSAVGHSQSPDPLSGTCFQANSETPTALSPHSDSHWRHSSSTSISVLRHIRGVYDYSPYKSTFYLLTYLPTHDSPRSRRHQAAAAVTFCQVGVSHIYATESTLKVIFIPTRVSHIFAVAAATLEILQRRSTSAALPFSVWNRLPSALRNSSLSLNTF